MASMASMASMDTIKLKKNKWRSSRLSPPPPLFLSDIFKYSNEDHGSISPSQTQFSLTSVSVLRSRIFNLKATAWLK